MARLVKLRRAISYARVVWQQKKSFEASCPGFVAVNEGVRGYSVVRTELGRARLWLLTAMTKKSLPLFFRKLADAQPSLAAW